MTEKIVVIGAGQCGAQAIASLRRGGFTGSLTLVGDEDRLPYQRPPLSKQFMASDAASDSLLFHPPGFYEENNVELLLDSPAKRLEPGDKRIELADGAVLNYDRLLLATGARPRQLNVPGHDLGNVFELRSAADALTIRPHLQPGKRLVVIGGGFIGLEVAATARKLGLDVTVLEAASRLMARVISPLLSSWFHGLHEDNGVKVRTDVTVDALEGNGDVATVSYDKQKLVVDLVVAGIGVIPNQELAADCGLECDDGIVVDASCRTSNADIFAGGDCTRHPNAFYGRALRLESVHNAVSQGRIAAAAMLDQPANYDELPWFWSDQFDAKLQMVGVPDGYDQLILRGNPDEGSFGVLHLRGDELVAGHFINRAKDYMACRRHMPNRPKVDAAALQDTDVPLNSLLA